MYKAAHTSRAHTPSPAMALGAAALLLGALGALAYLLWGAGSPADRQSGVSADGEILAQEGDPDQGSTDETTTLSLDDLPDVTYDLVISRDPFEPVRPEPVAENGDGNGAGNGNGGTNGNGNGGTNGNGSGSDGGRDDGSGTSNGQAGNGTTGDKETGAGTITAPGTPPPPRPGQPCEPAGTFISCDGILLRVLTAGDSSARVQIGDVVYEPQVGQPFAQDFVLNSTRGGCASITYDGRQAFQACPDGVAVK